MSHIRLTGELIARPNPPHPMLMNEEDFVSVFTLSYYHESFIIIYQILRQNERSCKH